MADTPWIEVVNSLTRSTTIWREGDDVLGED